MNRKPTYQDLEQRIKTPEKASMQVDRSHAIARYITANTHAEKNPYSSGKIFASAFYLNPNPMAITDMVTGDIINANQAFERRTGYSPKEFIGASEMDLNISINPGDRTTIVNELKSVGEISGRELMMR